MHHGTFRLPHTPLVTLSYHTSPLPRMVNPAATYWSLLLLQLLQPTSCCHASVGPPHDAHNHSAGVSHHHETWILLDDCRLWSLLSKIPLPHISCLPPGEPPPMVILPAHPLITNLWIFGMIRHPPTSVLPTYNQQQSSAPPWSKLQSVISLYSLLVTWSSLHFVWRFQPQPKTTSLRLIPYWVLGLLPLACHCRKIAPGVPPQHPSSSLSLRIPFYCSLV